MTNFALTHVLPRIADAPHEQGLIIEALVAAIAQSAPEAKERIQQSKRAGTKGGKPK